MKDTARSSKGFLQLKSKKGEEMRQSMTSFKGTERDPGEYADGAPGGELCPFSSCGRKFGTLA